MLSPLRSLAALSLLLVSTLTPPLRASAAPAPAADLPHADRAVFATPTVDHANAPLWVWNDLLSEEQIRSSLRDLAGQGVLQAFVHPRPGLMTPYLGADWFRLWRVALDEAAKLGMKLWIYDENSYPSGFAGGAVPEALPASRGLGLTIEQATTAPAWRDDLVAVYRVESTGYTNITASLRAAAPSGATAPTSPTAGRYVVASRQVAKSGPWYAGRTYVNLLTPGVTQKFLELTLAPYQRELGSALGRQVPGIFTDEPHIRPAGDLPWADDLPARFRERWGYSLLDHLPALSLEVGDWRRVRYHYFRLLNELFVARWAKPYYDACTQAGLEFTGHYWEHSWPRCNAVPDNMTMASWQHRPGIDILMNEYADGPNAQFGNARSVREIASLSNQLGRARNLCELYGAGGWDLRFEDMKRMGDWLLVLGCNTIDEHLSYVSLRGGRKRDHPQSFSYHEPWWPDYHHVARRFARLTAALTQGRQVNRVLLLEPTTSAWMYNVSRGPAPQLDTLGRSFQDTVNAFEAAQIGYDLGSEYVLGQHGRVTGRQLAVGAAAYDVIVLPAHLENLDASTLALLESFLAAGGQVAALASVPPARIDGTADPRGAALATRAGWKHVALADLLPALADRAAATFAVRRAPGDRGLLFHQRRQLADGEIIFLVNSSLQHASAGTLRLAATRVECWDPATGAISTYPSRSADAARREADFLLPPAGSLLLFAARSGSEKMDTKAAAAAAGLVAAARTLPPLGPVEIARAEPNVLTLDFVDVTAQGETRADLYCYRAAQFIFTQHGLKANPWESSVQYRDELLQRTFPAESGFSASYRFTVEQRVPADLALVLERADLYAITCNGQPVTPTPGAWWLDRAFGVVPLAAAARVGENVVTLTARPLTHLHELEPAYLRGSFALRPSPAGFIVEPDAPLVLGAWRDQGHPFYAAGVAYRQKFELPAAPAGRYTVTLPSWYGSVARVRVNGQAAGVIAWAPWSCDVTSLLRPGENTIEVQVVGTLKNTLGPHHNNPPLGRAWPTGFRAAPKTGRAPGTEYSTVGYGLFAPFLLQNVD